MSPGIQGVFQLLKEVAFRRILVFFAALHSHINRVLLIYNQRIILDVKVDNLV